IGPWGITIDGNDHVWIANGLGKTVTELCGIRTETCPPGSKTGDPISPPKTGYLGKGMQYLTGVVVDPAGNVWVANNIDPESSGRKHNNAMRRQRLRGVLRPCKACENASDRRSGPHTVGPLVRLIAISLRPGTHHRLFRAGPRANRTFSLARNPIPCATSSTNER